MRSSCRQHLRDVLGLVLYTASLKRQLLLTIITTKSEGEMELSSEFLNMILDSVTEHIVVIDKAGNIRFANRSWTAFGKNNDCDINDSWDGVNYIEVCDAAAKMGDDFGLKAGDGIRRVIAKEDAIFYFEYPCHSPQEKRWFMMRVTPFEVNQESFFVISHQNITERKLAEESVKNLANLDGLTSIANRRVFDEFLHEEWRRCYRLSQPISLAIIDLDNFKVLNDKFGHQFGDKCLIDVAKVLAAVANRPGDICARYGGEEFALVCGDTTLEQIKLIADRLLLQVTALNDFDPNLSSGNYLTASIGIAEMRPETGKCESELISRADAMLYKAKENGRNRIEG